MSEHDLRLGEFRAAESAADLIFRGRVLTINTVGPSVGASSYTQHVRLAVETVWKGDVPAQIIVTKAIRTTPTVAYSDASYCATTVARYLALYSPQSSVQSEDEFVGGTYVVFAGRTLQAELEVFRLRQSSQAQLTLSFLGPGNAPNLALPLPAAPVATGAITQPNTTFVVPFVILGVAVAIGVAILARTRFRRR